MMKVLVQMCHYLAIVDWPLRIRLRNQNREYTWNTTKLRHLGGALRNRLAARDSMTIICVQYDQTTNIYSHNGLAWT